MADIFNLGDVFTVSDTGAVVAKGGLSTGTAGNQTVAGTLGVTGVATFTAESVHNGGIDADYVTVDAAAGIDTKTAGTLKVGAATANKLEVGKSGVETEVVGTLDVLEAATLKGTVVVTGLLTANGGVSGAVSGVVTGTVKHTVAPQTAATLTLGATHDTVICDTTSNGIAITLPAATGTGKRYLIMQKVRGGTNDVTVTRAGSDVLNASNHTVATLNAAEEAIELMDIAAGRWLVLTNIGEVGLA